MSRPKTFKNSVVISCRFEEEDYLRMQEIAALRSSYVGEKITALDLIRYACSYCYEDDEILREIFRRTREHINRRIAKGYGK